jgi:tetratricopeptide (TPR) repeat protein
MQGQVARIEREAMERIAPRTSATSTATDPAPPATPKGNVRTSRQLLFLHDLKVVHPQELYANVPALGDDPANVLARYTDSSTQRTDRAEQRRVQYIAFMEDALGKFVRNDHKGCLEELRFLLQQYPDDVNALFYAGLCSYNLGMNERARSFLHRAATHSIDVFDEEATWYHALSLEQLGETEAAQGSFARIVARNGFYAQRAQERLSGR